MPIKSLWSSFPQMANPDSKHEPEFAGAAAAFRESGRDSGWLAAAFGSAQKSLSLLFRQDPQRCLRSIWLPSAAQRARSGPGMPRVLNTGSQPRQHRAGTAAPIGVSPKELS